MNRSKKMKQFAAIALAGVLAASGSMAAFAEESDSGVTADKIVFGISSLDTLDPFEGNVFQGMNEVYEALFRLDGTDGEMYALLADPDQGEYGGYDHEEGTSDYTIYLRDNIYDHAGNHLTASDVVFSYTYRYENYSTSWDAFGSVEAVDDTTVVFHFTRELTGISDWDTYFYGDDVYVTTEQAFNDSESGFVNDMCGTGPYKFVSYTPGSGVVIEKYDEYWGNDNEDKKVWQEANVQTIEYDVIAEESQRIIALQSGEVDIVDGVSTTYVDQLVSAGFGSYTYSSNMIMCALANCSETSILSDENLRKAIFYAIDSDAVNTAYKGQTETAYVLGIEAFSDWDESWVTTESYCNTTNQDLVDEYLEAAGYNGEEIKLMVMGMDMFTLAGQVVQNQLVEAGLNVTLLTYEGATFMSLMAEEGEWDLALNCSNAYDFNATFWNEFFSTAKTSTGLTQQFIDDEEWSSLLDTIMLTEGHTIENMTEWLEIAIDNAYFMPLVGWTSTVIYPSNVSEFRMTYGSRILPGSFTYSSES